MGIEEARFAGTRRFLDNVSLATLLAPVEEEDFRASYFEKKPLILHRGDRDFYGDLLTLQDFDRAVACAPSYVKTAEAKSNKHTRSEGDTASGLERALGEFRNGATLVLDSLQTREPKLGLLCRLLEQQLGHYFQTNIYLTPPNGQGFNPHYDSHDVFVLQVSGSKHWKLENQRRKFPPKNEDMGEEGREFLSSYDSFTLNQGDMIYIPRGYVHAAECAAEPSLHITLGLIPYTWHDLLQATMKAAVLNDERLHHALPLGFLHGDRDGLVKGAMAAFHKIGDETFLNAVVDQYRDELITKFPLDISGQIATFVQPGELSGEDIVGPRPGIVYRIHAGDETVRINFGARSITFPGFLREALDFALNTPVYAIGDVAGGLEAEEKLTFVGRLLEEGLVVRK